MAYIPPTWEGPHMEINFLIILEYLTGKKYVRGKWVIPFSICLCGCTVYTIRTVLKWELRYLILRKQNHTYVICSNIEYKSDLPRTDLSSFIAKLSKSPFKAPNKNTQSFFGQEELLKPSLTNDNSQSLIKQSEPFREQ